MLESLLPQDAQPQAAGRSLQARNSDNGFVKSWKGFWKETAVSKIMRLHWAVRKMAIPAAGSDSRADLSSCQLIFEENPL